MCIALYDKKLLTFSTQHFEVRRKRLGDELLAAVVVGVMRARRHHLVG